MKPRVLVTGATGLVGTYLIPSLIPDYDVYAISRMHYPNEHYIRADLTDTKSVQDVLNDVKPAIIVNLAAYTDVEGCETNREVASRINCDLVASIVEFIRNSEDEHQPYLLHVSTDYVFDGCRGNYSEISETHPINWYGTTKLCGEMRVARLISNWSIARISTPFGAHEHRTTFPKFVLDRLSRGESIQVVSDQFTSPTYTGNLAVMLKEIIDRRIDGVIHVSGSSRLSRYEQALMISDFFGLDSELILRSKASEMNWKARRPLNSTLDVSLANRILKNKPISFQEGIALFARDIEKMLQENTRSP